MIGFIAAVAASTLLEQANLNAEEPGLKGSVVFNLSSASGNTNNTVLGGRLNLAYKKGVVTHAFEAGGNYTETTRQDEFGEDVTQVTQNNWFVQHRIEVQTGDRTFLYGRARYEEDQFSGFDSKAFLGGGVGHTLIKRKTTKLQFLVGPGVQYFELARPDPVPEDFERMQTSAAVFFGETFEHIIRDNITLEQSMDATVSDENTTLANVVSLKSNLTDKISLRTSYAVKHETDPPENRENTDTLLSVSIGYDF